MKRLAPEADRSTLRTSKCKITFHGNGKFFYTLIDSPTIKVQIIRKMEDRQMARFMRTNESFNEILSNSSQSISRKNLFMNGILYETSVTSRLSQAPRPVVLAAS